MNEPKKTRKRIVSKSEYVRTEIKRVIYVVGATIFLFVLIPMCFVSIMFGIWFVVMLLMSICSRSAAGVLVSIILLIVSLVFGALTYILWKLSLAGLNYSDNIGNLVPLTHATLAEVPVFETLVRASQEPVQPQEDILLRPAMEQQEQHEEQLLRASTGGQE